MAFFRNIRTLGGALGSFGRSVIERAIELGRTVGEALRIIEPLAPEVAVPEVIHEWGQVRVAGERKEQFAALAPEATVPVDWFEESEIPWDKPIAYTVAIYGRDLIGMYGPRTKGRFASQEFTVTVSRPLTVEEVLDEAARRIGMTGASPTMDIFSIKLVGASVRAGEEWRW